MTRSQHLSICWIFASAPLGASLNPQQPPPHSATRRKATLARPCRGWPLAVQHGTDQLTGSAKMSGDPELHGRVIPSAPWTRQKFVMNNLSFRRYQLAAENIYGVGPEPLEGIGRATCSMTA